MAFPTDWGRRCAIVIDNTNVDGDLSNFPVLVHATGGAYNGLPEEMFDADGSYPALEGGGDIRFSSDSAGSSQLACEVVSFHIDNDPSNGYAEIYVNVATVTAASSTTIYVWYKKSGESQPAQDAAYGQHATWNSDFQAAWHLNETSGTRYDSTGNENDLTDNATVGSATGKVGQYCADFELGDSEYLSIADVAQTGLEMDGDYTVSFWMNNETENTAMAICSKYDPSAGNGLWGMWVWVVDDYQFTLAHLEAWVQEYEVSSMDASNTDVGTFYHTFTTYDDSENELIFMWNGSADVAKTMTKGVANNAGSFNIGEANGEYYDGKIDEFRVSTIVRAAAWGKAEYYNMNDPGTFCVEGTPESVAGAVDVTVEPSNVSGTFSAVAIAAIILSSVLSPSVQAFTTTIPPPNIIYDYTTSLGAAQTLTSSAQSPIIKFDYTISLSTAQVGTFSQPAVTITGTILLSPSVQSFSSSLPVPTIKFGSTLSPGAQTYTTTIPPPTIIFDYTVSVSEQSVTVSLPAPTAGVSKTVAVGVNTITSSAINPAITGDANVTPSAQTGTISQPTPTIIAGTTATISPLTGVYTFSQPSLTVTGGALASVAVQTLTFSLPTVVLPQQAVIQPLAGAYTFSLPTPTVRIESVTAFPAVQDITASQPTITITTDQILSLSAQVGTFSQPGISFILNYVQNVGVQDATFSLPSPSIYTDEDITIQVAVQTASFSLPEESIVSENILSVAVQDVTTSLPAVSITGDGLVSPNAQAGTFTAQSPTIAGNALASLDAQDATFTLPEITLKTVNAISVGVQTLTFSQPAVAITGLRAHCYPVVQTATFHAMSTTVVISIPIPTAPTKTHIRRIREWPYPDFGEFRL